MSDAYILEIRFGENGGVLRIYGDPMGDLVGRADERMVFKEILVPVRKLEWLAGGGEVLLLGVD